MEEPEQEEPEQRRAARVMTAAIGWMEEFVLHASSTARQGDRRWEPFEIQLDDDLAKL
ncbi:MAG: hypothetical protein WD271_01950 [Acidimicrobiia bacterium]